MNLEQEIKIASVELIRNFNFYGHIMVQLPKIIVKKGHSVPTLGVGKNRSETLIKLYVNKDYVEPLYAEHGQQKAYTHLLEVMKHEVLHIRFGHLHQCLPDKTRAAVAVDLAVNSYLDRSKLIDEHRKKAGSKLLTDMPKGGGCFPEDYNLEPKKSAIWYYNQLLNNEEFKNQMKNAMFGPGGMHSDVVQAHGLWDEAKKDPMLEEMCKDLVRKAASICKETKKWGDVPGEVYEDLSDLEPKKPLVTWQYVLRLFVASTMDSVLNSTIKKRSRRYDTRPGSRIEDRLNIAIGIDTSGSISDEQLRAFFNELYWINKNDCKMTVFECDTEIHREYPYKQFNGKVTGRGGTNLEPVLEEVEKRRFDGLIFFTDFYTPQMTRVYNIPILWVLSHCDLNYNDFPYKKGIFMKLSDEGDGVEVVRG